ncbi:TPA: sensor histidine kinase [Streptococcus equi subsp. zooepidemicus]|uniref:Sensor histidine kinase n=4 Tax=Streptococcus equi subsp. zooepidemicus TaxID=40041 RepID=B4U4H0_STREM|nr:sensor histidine kinase [Streptococcus equi]KIS12000.1 sensor histidine kinase [Streptococcus equi subsp. zooepidemicus Sz105]KIS16617.1 sensor histidine kinase [Streptococcus equi subsp. zooepidemicus Sz4is]HEL1015731.1 sensor histidine kinase [Streptococcus equi subsp. ruminatorum]ACG62887.1 TCS sensor kinase YvqE-like [Streptococcus equi subsp. zooepidemicus MGCS10565]AEJ25892.1 TCS sensor kinase YvqE-like protein [Streptococcus equi subsp. zooepidemicus ATCC 35246]
MKKRYYALVWLYSTITILSIVFVVMDNLGITFDYLRSHLWQLERLVFSVVLLIISVTLLLLLLWIILDDNSKRSINKNLRRILNNQRIHLEETSEINTNLTRLSAKMSHITTNIQKKENAYILDSQKIVQQERKRIARDLHDTVSQELFASSMILSGVSMSLDQMDKEQLQQQLVTVEAMLQNAQNDLRILLLHLRPTELANRSLSEGFTMILKELTDKSGIEVVYKENIGTLPKAIEDNLFRIAQEFISNTLKHAKASRLEVYLNQTPTELQLKMVDNGVGFDMDQVRELSYGLKNIEDRVNDLAGTLRLISQKGKGVSMDIRLPLVMGDEDE